MGISKEYVRKVCYNFYTNGAEYCINYIFENPSDNNDLKPIQEEDD